MPSLAPFLASLSASTSCSDSTQTSRQNRADRKSDTQHEDIIETGSNHAEQSLRNVHLSSRENRSHCMQRNAKATLLMQHRSLKSHV
eukprot:1793295-Rhodomonas_salina.2